MESAARHGGDFACECAENDQALGIGRDRVLPTCRVGTGRIQHEEHARALHRTFEAKHANREGPGRSALDPQRTRAWNGDLESRAPSVAERRLGGIVPGPSELEAAVARAVPSE